MNFEEARLAHQAGDLSTAEAIYTEILIADPMHFNSMHLLGVIALQTGRMERGVD